VKPDDGVDVKEVKTFSGQASIYVTMSRTFQRGQQLGSMSLTEDRSGVFRLERHSG